MSNAISGQSNLVIGTLCLRLVLSFVVLVFLDIGGGTGWVHHFSTVHVQSCARQELTLNCSTLMGTLQDARIMEGWGRSKVFPFLLPIVYCYLRFTQMRRVGTSQLEDTEGGHLHISTYMQLVGKIGCGLVGEVNTIKLWMNLTTKFRPEVNKPLIRHNLM